MAIEKQSLEPVAGFPREMGYYLAGMEEVRAQLRKIAADLSDEEMAAKLTPDVHSIGQLILHNAEAEWWWIECVVAEKDLDEEEAKVKAHWDVLLDEDFASKNYSARFCIAEIDRVRELSKETLSKFSDADLDRFFGWNKTDGTRIEKSLRWILHHLIDHEAQHKGQILMLKRLLRQR
ncbi:MAG: DinB family protein [Pyrinomonadaceae bacterium]